MKKTLIHGGLVGLAVYVGYRWYTQRKPVPRRRAAGQPDPRRPGPDAVRGDRSRRARRVLRQLAPAGAAAGHALSDPVEDAARGVVGRAVGAVDLALVGRALAQRLRAHKRAPARRRRRPCRAPRSGRAGGAAGTGGRCATAPVGAVAAAARGGVSAGGPSDAAGGRPTDATDATSRRRDGGAGCASRSALGADRTARGDQDDQSDQSTHEVSVPCRKTYV